MNILRKQEMDIGKASDYRIGDQIQVGKYTATCQKVTDDAAIFLLDQYLDKAYRLNTVRTYNDRYETSALRAAIASADFVAGDENFASIRDHLVPFSNGDLLRIPTVGEMFGSDIIVHGTENDDGWGPMKYEMDNAEQWDLMKDPRNRIANQDGEEYPYGWLQNRVLDLPYFALVSPGGCATCFYAGEINGVRPVFQLAD